MIKFESEKKYIMTNTEVLEIAMRQSAVDCNCDAGDFRLKTNKVVLSADNPLARKYLTLPFYCDLVSYGDNVVASVSAEIADFVEKYINKYPIGHCFETPNLHMLNDELQKHGMRICFMAEYFLPDVEVLKRISCGYDIKLLFPKDFIDLYKPEWENSLCEKRKTLDMLAMGAFDKEKLIGLAGCSADCEDMWQIGVDVLPEYRKMGIASALTSNLAVEILNRNKVPFYCCAWSNIRSVRNAIKSGFKPAWAEMTAKSIGFVNEMNK